MKQEKEQMALLEDAEVLRREADKLLKKINLLEIINKYFDCYIFVGSYFSNTMVWNDIDICVCIKESHPDAYRMLMSELLGNKSIYRMVYKNEFNEMNEHKNAYYIGVYYSDCQSMQHWKIDIKCMKKAQFEICKERRCLFEKLSSDQRALIIKAKKGVSTQIDEFYRPPKAMSSMIQQLVITRQCNNIEEIMEELRR